MTRWQHWMAAWAGLGMLIGPAMQSVADEPAAAGPRATASGRTAAVHLDLTFIPTQAVAAIVAHPQAVLSGPDSEWLPTEVITAAGMKHRAARGRHPAILGTLFQGGGDREARRP